MKESVFNYQKIRKTICFLCLWIIKGLEMCGLISTIYINGTIPSFTFYFAAWWVFPTMMNWLVTINLSNTEPIMNNNFLSSILVIVFIFLYASKTEDILLVALNYLTMVAVIFIDFYTVFLVCMHLIDKKD